MRKLLFGICLIVLTLPATLSGQGSWLDATNVVGNGDVIITDMAIGANGNSYIMGWFNANIVSTVGSIITNGNYDIFLLKINSDGTHAWLKGFGGAFPDLPGGVEIGPDSSVYITGSVNGTVFFDPTTSITTTGADAFLANFKPDGTLNWVKPVAGGPNNQRSEAMALDTINNRIVLAGLAVDSVIYDVDRVGYPGKFTHIASYDLAGNNLSHNTIGFKDVGLPTSIISTIDGYAISGYFRDSLFMDIDTFSQEGITSSSDIYLYKVDNDLIGQWVRRTTSQFGENIAYSIRYDGADDLYAVGKTGSLDLEIDSTNAEKIRILRTSGSDEFIILNYSNANGNLNWYTIGGSKGIDALWDLKILPDRLVATGYYSGSIYFSNDTLRNFSNPVGKEILVAEFGMNGQLQHARSAQSESVHYSDQGYRVGLNKAGEVVIAGVYRSEVINFEEIQFNNNSPGSPDIFLSTFGCKGDGTLATSSVNLTCYGDYSGEMTITATGGYTNLKYGHAYDLFFDNGDTVINKKISSSPATLTGLPAGIYDITVYDNANCMIGTSIETITQPDSMQFSYAVVQPDCNAAETGSITISGVSGGTSPYQFSINCGADFSVDSSFSDLPAGDYCIIVEDANGCQTQAIDTSLTDPEVLTFEFELTKDSLNCFGDSNAEIHIKNVSGGTGGYLFSIDGGANYQADSFFLGLPAWDYQLIVSDANACATAVIDTSIFQPEKITYEYSITDSVCFGESADVIFMNAMGGTGDLSYTIDGAVFQSEAEWLGVSSGSFELFVVDENMCSSDTAFVDLEVPTAALTIDSVSFVDNMGDIDGLLTVHVSGGVEPYTYFLQPTGIEQEGDNAFVLPAGESSLFFVVVDDAHGCGPVNSDSVDTHTPSLFEPQLNALIYPNPSNGELTIKMMYDEQDCTIEVLSLAGQVVDSRRAFTSGGELKEVLDLGHLAKGMYMIRIDGRVLRSGVVLK